MTQATEISGGQSAEGEGGCSYIFIKNTNVYFSRSFKGLSMLHLLYDCFC